MNFKEAMIEAMTSRGMFESQAEEVMVQVIEQNLLPDMETRWYEDVRHYPENLVNILWLNVKEVAYKWIEEHAPMAWFKPMFQFSNKELADIVKERANKNA